MGSIIIAEDHKLMIEGYRLLISQIPELEIIATANDGQTAIHKIDRLKPEYLLLDLHLPKVQGIDVLKYLSVHHPHIKVLVISMFGDPSIYRKAVKLGAKAYVLKQADPEVIIMALKLVMKGETFYSKDILEKKNFSEGPVKAPKIIPLASLTKREEQILMLIAQGLTNKEIAEKLYLSFKTVDNHRTNLMKKIKVHNVTGLIKYAMANGYDV